jgi:hypothetical protein
VLKVWIAWAAGAGLLYVWVLQFSKDVDGWDCSAEESELVMPSVLCTADEMCTSGWLYIGVLCIDEMLSLYCEGTAEGLGIEVWYEAWGFKKFPKPEDCRASTAGTCAALRGLGLSCTAL